jgi:hypothetical protein
MEKMAHICQILNFFFPKSPVYYDKLQWVAKNIESFFSFHILYVTKSG